MLIMVACYVIYLMIAGFKFPLGLSIFIGIVAVTLLGVFLYVAFMKKLKGSVNSLVLLTGGLAMIMEQAVIITIGPTAKFVPSMVKGSISIIGVEVSYQQIISVIAAFLLMGLLWIFLNRTKVGRALVGQLPRIGMSLLCMGLMRKESLL